LRAEIDAGTSSHLAPVNNPISLIGESRRRLSRLSAIQGALTLALPFALTVGLVAAFDQMSAMVADRWGYTLAPDRAGMLKQILLGATVVELLAMAAFAVSGYLKVNDYLVTAVRIDDHIGAHQEILTLATMTDPSNQRGRERRSPLFPMLWRRTIAYLDLFEPRREFRLQPGGPLKRSSLIAGLGLIALGIGLIAMAQPLTPMDQIARQLKALARTLEAPGSSPPNRSLAAAVRAVSNDLANPNLPPEQKIQELAALKREVEKQEKDQKAGRGAMSALASAGGGSGNASGDANGKGGGQGKGGGAGAGGQGNGSAQGSGPGQSSGSDGKGDKSSQGMVELSNQIAKAQAQIAMDSGPRDRTQGSQQLAANGAGVAPKAGNNPNATAPGGTPNATRNAALPKPGGTRGNGEGLTALPGPQASGSSGRKDDTGSSGDTHLGDMPKPGNFERFYAAGEGPPMQIHDARYVTFRIPTKVESSGTGGSLVADNGQAKATAAYSNLPLKQERIADTPDEQQLVPPRYRDLIH